MHNLFLFLLFQGTSHRRDMKRKGQNSCLLTSRRHKVGNEKWFKPFQYFYTKECCLTGDLSLLLVPVFFPPFLTREEKKKQKERKEELNLNGASAVWQALFKYPRSSRHLDRAWVIVCLCIADVIQWQKIPGHGKRMPFLCLSTDCEEEEQR